MRAQWWFISTRCFCWRNTSALAALCVLEVQQPCGVWSFVLQGAAGSPTAANWLSQNLKTGIITGGTLKEVHRINWNFFLFSTLEALCSRRKSKRARSARCDGERGLSVILVSQPAQTHHAELERRRFCFGFVFRYQRAADNRALLRTALLCIITTHCAPSFVIPC